MSVRHCAATTAPRNRCSNCYAEQSHKDKFRSSAVGKQPKQKKSNSQAQLRLPALDLFWANFFVRVQLTSLLISPGLCNTNFKGPFIFIFLKQQQRYAEVKLQLHFLHSDYGLFSPQQTLKTETNRRTEHDNNDNNKMIIVGLLITTVLLLVLIFHRKNHDNHHRSKMNNISNKSNILQLETNKINQNQHNNKDNTSTEIKNRQSTKFICPL